MDKSSNGTFVDDRKAGKNRREVLSHNSYVSMASAKNKNFVYLSSSKDYQRQYPVDLRNKYIVSKELGKVSELIGVECIKRQKKWQPNMGIEALIV